MLLFNPFEENIVKNPRKIEPSIKGLNDEQLELIISRFRNLTGDPSKTKKSINNVQLVLSPDAGYGKSHFIGRLFKSLTKQATLVYLEPFEDPSSCWKTILLKIVQEMQRPDVINVEYSEKQPSQAEAFAHGVLSNLVSDAVKKGHIRVKGADKDTEAERIKSAVLSNFRKEQKWTEFFNKYWKELINFFGDRLSRSGIILNANCASWLGILIHLAYFPYDFMLTNPCLSWLKGGTIDPESAKSIGLDMNDNPDPDMGTTEKNELCRNRIMDLCLLAGFFRPFVFCFDQIENYSKDESLVKSLGLVIQVMVNEFNNHLTVITSREDIWKYRVLNHLEQAEIDRFGKPISLNGINRDQAEKLIDQRFKLVGMEETKNFQSHEWLKTEVFNDIIELGIRKFLNLCSEHYIETTKEVEIVTPAKNLEYFYQVSYEKIVSQTSLQVYNPNALYWCFHEAAAGIPGLTIEKHGQNMAYISLHWNIKARNIYFGFEESSDGRVWNAILREVKRYYAANKDCKIIFLRTPDLEIIPRASWVASAPEFEKAKSIFLHILTFNREDLYQLYASHDLYNQAMQGNIPFDPSEVIKFVFIKMKFLWDKVLAPVSEIAEKPEHPVEVTKEMINKVRGIMKERKFLSTDELLSQLNNQISPEQLFKACGYISEIEISKGPSMWVVLWK